jgi:hypothetical protein
MAKVIVALSMSLDGFIAGPNDSGSSVPVSACSTISDPTTSSWKPSGSSTPPVSRTCGSASSSSPATDEPRHLPGQELPGSHSRVGRGRHGVTEGRDHRAVPALTMIGLAPSTYGVNDAT